MLQGYREYVLIFVINVPEIIYFGTNNFVFN